MKLVGTNLHFVKKFVFIVLFIIHLKHTVKFVFIIIFQRYPSTRTERMSEEHDQVFFRGNDVS